MDNKPQLRQKSSMKKPPTALSPDEIRVLIRDRSFAKVARGAGVSADTLYRLRDGVGTPTNATLLLLTIYLQGGTNGQA